MRSHAKAVVAVSAVLLLTLALAANPASAIAPTATIDPPTEVAYTSVKASGEVDPGDQGTYWSFETSTDGGASWSGFGFHGYVDPSEGKQPTPLELTGLTPGTDYELRLTAWNFSDPEAFSSVESFSTLPVAKPTVTLNPVSGIAGEEAHFEGEIDTNAPDSNENLSDKAKEAFATTYRFECTPACPDTPGNQTIEADDEPQTVSFDATNLEPDTPYTVKLFASNAGGEEVAEQSFETNALAPTVAAGTVGALTHNSARLTAYVDANNAATEVSFEYDEDAGFSSPTTAQSGDGTMIDGNGNKVAYADVSGLDPQQTYFWRVGAESAEGTDEDTAPRSFEPWPTPPADQGGIGAFGARQVELVSKPDTVAVVAAKPSLDGERVLYDVAGGTDDSSEGSAGQTLSTRTAAGWVTSNPLPLPERLGGDRPNGAVGTPDLGGFLFKRKRTGLAAAGEEQFMRHVPGADLLTPGYSWQGGGGLGLPIQSEDLEHIVLATDRPLSGPVGPGTHLYDVGSGEPELIGLLPDGSDAACLVQGSAGGTDWPAQYNADLSQYWVSRDGNRVFFGAGGTDCTSPPQLYMREGGAAGETTLISGPPLAGDPQGAVFVRAAPDGSWVFYTTATRLDPADANSGIDLYRHRVGAGNECLTCLVPEAEPDQFGSTARSPGVAVAADGSRAYFTSPKALAPGARAGARNVYLWSEGSPQLEFVAPSSGLMPISSDPDTAITPAGGTLVFRSDRPELDRLTGTENGGLAQYYRFDQRDRTLSCVSCPAIGAPPVTAARVMTMPGRGLDGISPGSQILTDDGRDFAFSTASQLLAADVNGTLDVYEWREGRLGLVTDGLTKGSAAKGGAISTMWLGPDGRDLFFLSSVALDPRAENTAPALYVGRIGGGFPGVEAPAPCGGEGCRGPMAPAPAGTGAGSAQFSGPGNPRVKPRCAKGKARKKGRCVKKKSRNDRAKKRDRQAGRNQGGRR